VSHQLSKMVDVYGFSGSTGSTSVTVEVDMQNAEGCLFNAVGNTSAGALTLTISAAASTTDTFTNLSGATNASTGGVATRWVDIHKPRERWLKGTVTAGSATNMIVQAIKYGVRKPPVTWTSTAGLTALVSPNT